MLSLATSLWGESWGWNSDGKLYPQLGAYMLFSYSLLLLPLTTTLGVGARWKSERLSALLGKAGAEFIMWGVFVICVAVGLIQIFDSSALWLGTMSDFYVGFIILLMGILRVVST